MTNRLYWSAPVHRSISQEACFTPRSTPAGSRCDSRSFMHPPAPKKSFAACPTFASCPQAKSLDGRAIGQSGNREQQGHREEWSAGRTGNRDSDQTVTRPNARCVLAKQLCKSVPDCPTARLPVCPAVARLPCRFPFPHCPITLPFPIARLPTARPFQGAQMFCVVRKTMTSAGLFVLLFAAHSAAQQTNPQRDTLRPLPLDAVIVTAERTSATLGNSIGAVSALSPALLARRPVRTLAEAIQQAP